MDDIHGDDQMRNCRHTKKLQAYGEIAGNINQPFLND